MSTCKRGGTIYKRHKWNDKKTIRCEKCDVSKEITVVSTMEESGWADIARMRQRHVGTDLIR